MTVHVTLMGGLANQVFQYAAALSVVGEGNEDQIVADCSLLEVYQNTPGVTPRPFQLGALGVRPGPNEGPCDKGCLYHETTPHRYYPESNYRLQGYFQDLRFWEPWIRKWFRDRLPRVDRRVGTLAIHVRRGDYVTNPNATAWHGVTNRDFFLRDCWGPLTTSIRNILVFSDDPDWCQSELLPSLRLPASIVVGNLHNPWQDIAEMAACNYHVISNSTFGWLGAYLADSQTVVYPKKWLTDGKSAPPIFPESWHAR
jgi:hypothetical protein